MNLILSLNEWPRHRYLQNDVWCADINFFDMLIDIYSEIFSAPGCLFFYHIFVKYSCFLYGASSLGTERQIILVVFRMNTTQLH